MRLFFLNCVGIVYMFLRSYVESFFFCKQKTAYEMRISDWSSDVCSSDLAAEFGKRHAGGLRYFRDFRSNAIDSRSFLLRESGPFLVHLGDGFQPVLRQ